MLKEKQPETSVVQAVVAAGLGLVSVLMVVVRSRIFVVENEQEQSNLIMLSSSLAVLVVGMYFIKERK